VRGLIYPVPDPALPFLGVHLTRKIDGTVVLGPNAILSTARHAYERRRFVARDAYEALCWPGTLRMLRRHWRVGIDEIIRSASKRQFVRAVARYVPAVHVADVLPAPAGVRAQAIDRDGSLVDDFRLATHGNVTWVRNAPSPAATSSLAIAEELVAYTAPNA
jgi:L-2-hydroxyglutarate oxidase LhgO